MLCKRVFIQDYIGNTFKYCTKPVKPKTKRKDALSIGQKLTAARQMKAYFEKAPHLKSVRTTVPAQYLKQKKLPENLYLVDSEIANDAANRIFPILKKTKKHVICETNPGFGLLSSRLLTLGIPRLRLYESCSDFRSLLKPLNDTYPGRIELFVKDFFHLGRYSLMDKMDKGDRVEQMIRDVPRHEWSEEPVMSVIGTMPSMDFMRYLFRALALQSEIITRGRIQLFVFLRPINFQKMTAGPHTCNLLVYQIFSIFVNTFFDFQLLSEYPRKSFLPWEAPKKRVSVDNNSEILYLVWLKMKEKLPLTPEQILPYYSFVKNFYSKPTQKIIPTLEKWIPDIGVNIIVPSHDRKENRQGMNIYTAFGELKPSEVVALFKIVYNHPAYKSSPFMPMIDNQLLKNETVETDLADIAPHTTGDLEEKLLPNDDR